VGEQRANYYQASHEMARGRDIAQMGEWSLASTGGSEDAKESPAPRVTDHVPNLNRTGIGAENVHQLVKF